jgi:hypothetical protein
MRILAVGGCCSGVGKTTLMCRILENLPRWGALKVSPLHGEVTHGLEGPYRIDTGAVQPSGDSDRYRAAGAARVAWLRSRRDSLGTALGDALGGFADLPGVVVEGNAAALAGSPDGIVLVARSGQREIKDSAVTVARRADWVVLNRPTDDGTGSDPHETSRLEKALGVSFDWELDAAAGESAGTAAFIAAITAWARC